MANDISSGDYGVVAKAAERLQRARDNLAREETRARDEQQRVVAQSERDVASVGERAKREVNLVAKAGEEEKNKIAELNRNNVSFFNQQHQKRMIDLAEKAAAEVAAVEGKAIKEIHDLNLANMTKLLESSSRAEDPFYRAKQFTTEITEEPEAFNVKIKLPPYEARDVSVTGFSNQLKVSFNRSFESDTPVSPNQVNTTRTHQSVTETYELPTNLNFKKVSQSYADGTLSIKIAKASALKFSTEAKGAGDASATTAANPAPKASS